MKRVGRVAAIGGTTRSEAQSAKWTASLKHVVLAGVASVAACSSDGLQHPVPFAFSHSARVPRHLSRLDVDNAVRRALNPGESPRSVTPYELPGVGETVIQVVAESSTGDRAFVVDEDGRVEPTQQFWSEERAARIARFGRMTPELFAAQSLLADSDVLEVEIMVNADVPEPRPDLRAGSAATSSSDYMNWFSDNVNAQLPRIAAAKARLLGVLAHYGATLDSNPTSLPLVRAHVSVELLRSQALNASDIVRIDPPEPPGELLGYAGHAAMNAGALMGSGCGAGTTCNGQHIGVGLWERDAGSVTSGVARNNARLSSSSVYAYLQAPTACSVDADCTTGQPNDVERYCVAPLSAGTCRSTLDCAKGESCSNNHCVKPKMCAQDHLSWVAGSVGMNGAYDYATRIPFGVEDAIPNVPTGGTCTSNLNCTLGETCNASGQCVTQFYSNTGAWYINFKIGNSDNEDGLDFLTGTSGGAATPFVNHSYSGTPYWIDWPGRAYGTFVTAAAGDNGGSAYVTCSKLRNGLCVGWYDYKTYNDLTSHRRTESGTGLWGSNYINDPGMVPVLERPHLLGPGGHSGAGSGIHMPVINALPGNYDMEYAYNVSGGGTSQIGGSSFSSPAVLSAAIQAQQYAGWFSILEFPAVNKAVLMASTQDANADGPIGKTNTWSSQPSDAEDGAGQLNFGFIKQILDTLYSGSSNPQAFFRDLADVDFSSCGVGCREYTVASVAIPAQVGLRVALAWQSCLINELDVPAVTNDLDLALNCGSPIENCGGTTLSNDPATELEMLERPGCTGQRTCTVEVRIKNGATLQPCGSTTTERIGVAWTFRY